jgi:hypothetical protein
MRIAVLATVLLLPSAALAAETVKVNARDHSCGELAQIIRQSKAVFVRGGIGGRSFRYPPATCGLGDKRATVSIRDVTGKQCTLNYACVHDSGSFYNNP